MRRQRQGVGGGNMGVMLLAAQVMNIGIGNIPPVTLALVAGQVAIFLRCLPQYFPSAAAVCMSSYLVWYKGDYKRLILSQLFHANDMHLYFNMASLLVKGRTLELRFGSLYFAWMVSVFTALTSVGYIALNVILEDRLQDHSYATSCAVGFSGVLFALKVVTTHYSPSGLHYAMGFIPVPSRYIYWVELIMIQLIYPNASITGHLAGILVGLLYIKGPLKPIMDGLIPPASGVRSRAGGQSSGYRRGGWFSSGGTPGSRDPPPSNDGDKFQHYTGGATEEEQYRRAMADSRLQNDGQIPQPSAPTPVPRQDLYPDLDELRGRRAAHYQ